MADVRTTVAASNGRGQARNCHRLWPGGLAKECSRLRVFRQLHPLAKTASFVTVLEKSTPFSSVNQTPLEIVAIRDSCSYRALAAAGLAAEMAKLSADVLQGVRSSGERFDINELAQLEAALVQLRANVWQCERRFVELIALRGSTGMT